MERIDITYGSTRTVGRPSGEAFDGEGEHQQRNSSRPHQEAPEREAAAGFGGDGVEESGSPQHDARRGVAEETVAEREVVGCKNCGGGGEQVIVRVKMAIRAAIGGSDRAELQAVAAGWTLNP